MIRAFLEFLRQEVPKQGKEIPQYYRRALIASYTLLEVYYAVCFFFYPLFEHRWEWFPLLLIAATGGALWAVPKSAVRPNLFINAALCVIWVGWNVYAFGWGSGTQHFLTLMLVLVFFNVYDKPVYKLLWFAGILVFRVCLYSWSQGNPAVNPLSQKAGTVYQTVNTVAFFTVLAAVCIIFSTSIQDTERQLRLRNQTLYKEAGTDALTGLPNRRAMIETIERYRQANPQSPFSVAIGDIDFFKRINDTYGHNVGDYTLVKLTELLVAHASGRYSVCRWGGEEFCFFMPGLNIDEAAVVVNDVCDAVQKMELQNEETTYSITITIGVEEFDFASPLEELLDGADKKLYMGKNAGRNRVVY